jgi:hypothetical protein
MACCDLPSAEGWQSIRTPFDLLLGVLTRTTSKEQYETSRTATDFATLKFCACPWRFSGRSPSARPWWIYCRSNVVTAISGHSSKKKNHIRTATTVRVPSKQKHGTQNMISSLLSGYTSTCSGVIQRGDTYRVRNPWVLFRLMVLGW